MSKKTIVRMVVISAFCGGIIYASGNDNAAVVSSSSASATAQRFIPPPDTAAVRNVWVGQLTSISINKLYLQADEVKPDVLVCDNGKREIGQFNANDKTVTTYFRDNVPVILSYNQFSALFPELTKQDAAKTQAQKVPNAQQASKPANDKH